jgi:hypothetical protein
MSHLLAEDDRHSLAYMYAEIGAVPLLEPFGIVRYYTDGWDTYERHVEAEKHTVGKENTQKNETSP